MVERLRQHANARAVQVTMIILVVAFAWQAFVWTKTSSVDVYLPYVTSVMGACAAVLVAVFAFHPTDRTYRLSGWAITTTLMTRICQVIVNTMDGGVYQNPWTGVAGITHILLALLFIGKVWDRDVREWLREEQREEQRECGE